MLGRARNTLQDFTGRFEEVTDQIETIIKPEKHTLIMLTDIEKLDRLYTGTLNYFHDLELWIAAGEQQIHMLDATEIPALENIEETGEMLDASPGPARSAVCA